jgi:hypothetical protein
MLLFLEASSLKHNLRLQAASKLQNPNEKKYYNTGMAGRILRGGCEVKI